MRSALTLAAVAAVAYALGRRRVVHVWSAVGEAIAPDPMDEVQPADPATLPGHPIDWSKVRVWEPWPITTDGQGFGTFSSSDGLVPPHVTWNATLEPLSELDRDWLDQTVRSSLHPST